MKISEWLETYIGSHDLLPIKDTLKDLKAKTGFETGMIKGQKGKEFNKSVGEFKELQNPVDPKLEFIEGYRLAGQLDKMITGKNHGDMYYGRGSAYDANIDALQKINQ